MSKTMISAFLNIFKIPVLKRPIIFTLGMVTLFKIGCYITIPGVNAIVISEFLRVEEGAGLLGFLDFIFGSAFSRGSVFALHVAPYFSSKKVVELCSVFILRLKKLRREGEEGKKKLRQYIRNTTVFFASIQAYGVSIFLEHIKTTGGLPAVPEPGWTFRLLTILTLTAGAILVMWMGEQISDRGIGGGINIIILTGIISHLPNAIFYEFHQVILGYRDILTEILLIAMFPIVVSMTIFIMMGVRNIPIQYLKRVVGEKIYGGQSTHLPLKIIALTPMFGPIVFAKSVADMPRTIATFLPFSDLNHIILTYLNSHSWIYWVMYGFLIMFFTYFYSAIASNPMDIADNMKKHGGYIPGVRPGLKTAEFFDRIITKVAFAAGFFLAIIAVVPDILVNVANVSYLFASFFGGTQLLILVSIAFEILNDIEQGLLMRHYDGFMKSGRLRSRRF